MTKRTLQEIDAEERQLRARLIELEVEIENHPEKHPMSAGFELSLILAGQGKRLHELEIERQAIGLKLKALEQEEMAGDDVIDDSGLRAPRYGELKDIVNKLIERDGLKPGVTFDSKKIRGWIREYAGQGIRLSESSVRQKLTDAGCTVERKSKP